MENTVGEPRLKHPSLQERMNTLDSSARSDLYSILALDSVLQPWANQRISGALSIKLNTSGNYPDTLYYNSDGFYYGPGRVTLLETLEIIRAANVGMGDIVPQLEKQIPNKEIVTRIKDISQMRLSEFEKKDLVESVKDSYSAYANKAFIQMQEAEKAVDMPTYQIKYRWYNKLRKEAELDVPNEKKAQEKNPAVSRIAGIRQAVRGILGTSK